MVEGALFGPFKESGRSRARFSQATEGQAESEAEKVRGAPEGWKRCRMDGTASAGTAGTA
jgi:hypothetical protein